MADIREQFDKCANNVLKELHLYVVPQMVQYGMDMVNNILPMQSKYKNLTGNTITSYGFGVYHNGKLEVMGFNNAWKPALREKLRKDETVYDFYDYDGNRRLFFTATVDTDGNYGVRTSMDFLKSYRATGQFSIIFTTGTEYSKYLENLANLNVLSAGYEFSKSAFINSFRPVK